MSIPVRLLLLEDRQSDAELILHTLRRDGFAPVARRVDNREDFLAALDQEVDLILADFTLPQFDALEAMHLLRARGSDVPVIIVTGTISEETAVQCMREGAADYLLKDRLTRLSSAVSQAIEGRRLRREKLEAEQALARSEALNSAVLSSLTARIAVVEPDGKIIATNDAWERSARQRTSGGSTPVSVGASYLETYRLAAQNGDETANRALEGIQAVLAGRQPVFSLEYPDATPGGTRWYAMVVTPLADAAGGVVVSHSDITERVLREREREALVSISDALRNARTRAEIIPIVLDELIRLLKAEGGAFVQYDPITGQMWAEFARGCYQHVSGLRLLQEGGLTRHVLHSGVLYQRAPGLPGPSPLGEINGGAPLAETGLPLAAQGESLGVVWIASAAPLLAEDLQMLRVIGESAANTISRAALHENTARRLQRLTALREIEKAITSSLDVRVTLSVLVDEVTAQLSMDAADVFLVNPATKSLEFAASHGFRRAPDRGTRLPGQGHAYRAMLERRILSIPNVHEEREGTGGNILSLGENFAAYFAVPLIAKGQVKGVLEVFNRDTFYPNGEWLDFLETLAGQAAIAIDNAELFENLQRSNINLSLAYDNTIEGWSRALDLRDRETEGHTQRVTEMTLRLATAVGIPAGDLVYVRWGALLHDIGKMGIPDAILLKATPLTEEEWAIIRKHPDYAYEVLQPIAFLRPALDIPYCHHELWNGSGYPRGLKEKDIPLPARLFTIIDVYDALISQRPYREAWSKERVIGYIQEQSGVMFDPEIVKVFLEKCGSIEG